MKSTSWAKPTTGRRTKTLGRSWRKLGFRFPELLCACLSLSTGAARISEPWRGPTYKNFSKAASPTLTSGSLNKNSGSFRFYSKVSQERFFDVPQISFEAIRNWDSHRTQWIPMADLFLWQFLFLLSMARNTTGPLEKSALWQKCHKHRPSGGANLHRGRLQLETSEASEIPAMKITRALAQRQSPDSFSKQQSNKACEIWPP